MTDRRVMTLMGGTLLLGGFSLKIVYYTFLLDIMIIPVGNPS